MPRWEPDARGRLQASALQLFSERGYTSTTVEDIAAASGVTTRTFFRHYIDKREVLFGEAERFQQLFVDGLAIAPADASPFDAVGAALRAVGGALADGQQRARRRSRVIAAHTELRERELVKLASVASALAAALRGRGVPQPLAAVSAEAAVAAFRTAFDRWVADGETRSLPALLEEALAALRTFAAGQRHQAPEVPGVRSG